MSKALMRVIGVLALLAIVVVSLIALGWFEAGDGVIMPQSK